MVPMPLVFAGAYSCNHYMQTHLGSDTDFFDGSFITDKDPDDIAEFYQAEDLLKIISIFPFLFNIVMDKVVPDAEEATEETALLSVGETHFNVGLIGMEVSFEIIEHEEEGEDGESKLAAFIRHERFIDWVPILADYGVKVLLWDQTWKYGFRTLEDGKIEVYHHGESFLGPWPIRLIVMAHQYYVLWACQSFINGQAFGTDDIDEQQEQMGNIPLWKYKEFVSLLRTEKEKELQKQESNVKQDSQAIAKVQSEIQKLRSLELRPSPTMSIKKAKAASPFGGKIDKVRVVVHDKDMLDALETARHDAKENRTLNAAIKDLTTQREENIIRTKSSLRRKSLRRRNSNASTRG